MTGEDHANGHEWPEEIDTTAALGARIYDFYLGGDTNFAVDRQAATHAASVHAGGLATVRASVRSNRAFLARVVGWLAREAGVSQFLDIGSGIPNFDNVHEVAQRALPCARVVYVDHDPVVLAHAHQLLDGTPEGAVAYVQRDLHDPDSIVDQAKATLDFADPIALLLIGVLHFLPDSDDATDPYRIVSTLMDTLAPGSHLVVSHLARDIHPAEMVEVERRFNETTAETWQLRTWDEVRGFFRGLELREAGVVQVDDWRSGDRPGPVWPPEGRTNPLWVGVGRKS